MHDQLREAVERMHGGTATLAQSVPVRETFDGKTVWEGVVHVFDLSGHPTATRAYAWYSPIEGALSGGFSPYSYGSNQLAAGSCASGDRG